MFINSIIWSCYSIPVAFTLKLRGNTFSPVTFACSSLRKRLDPSSLLRLLSFSVFLYSLHGCLSLGGVGEAKAVESSKSFSQAENDTPPPSLICVSIIMKKMLPVPRITSWDHDLNVLIR